MIRTYYISNFGVMFDTILTELQDMAKKELMGLYASIIYMEHDLRTVSGMPAEDALKNALEDHNIKLGKSDLWQYALRFDTNKVAMLNDFMQKRALKLKMIYPSADMSFRLYYGKIDGSMAIELDSIHEEYFEFLESRPYVKREIRYTDTIFGKMCCLDEVITGSEYDIFDINLQELLNFNVAKYSDKRRRITMIIANDKVLSKAISLETWAEAAKTENPIYWLEKREAAAAQMLDDMTWNQILLERTGFDPTKMPDIEKSIKKVTTPIKGIFSNFLK